MFTKAGGMTVQFLYIGSHAGHALTRLENQYPREGEVKAVPSL